MIFFLRDQCLFEPGFFLEGLLLGLFVLPNDRKCCLDVRGVVRTLLLAAWYKGRPLWTPDIWLEMFDKQLVARCINGGQVALDAGNDQQQQVEQHRNEQAIYIVQCRDGDSVANDAINNVWQVA